MSAVAILKTKILEICYNDNRNIHDLAIRQMGSNIIPMLKFINKGQYIVEIFKRNVCHRNI